MQLFPIDPADDSHLRVVFRDRVVSLNLAVDATFGEVARMLGECSDGRHGNPSSIVVTLRGGLAPIALRAQRRALPVRRMRAPVRRHAPTARPSET